MLSLMCCPGPVCVRSCICAWVWVVICVGFFSCKLSLKFSSRNRVLILLRCRKARPSIGAYYLVGVVVVVGGVEFRYKVVYACLRCRLRSVGCIEFWTRGVSWNGR